MKSVRLLSPVKVAVRDIATRKGTDRDLAQMKSKYRGLLAGGVRSAAGALGAQ
jgi:hypothetical protein